ncbi:Zona pellucida sperm-binding protein 3 [Platysternon megacephalum]|uniref:Zona pellucida sperm-binding protein 3 n=1 Tax=Platysternon megacephalum TaxID=55544 RepID=A0A4D9E1Z4_9SAUR|nr:Zona pellucida sperm-binding protein 3 [Platysternon megacephalum]
MKSPRTFEEQTECIVEALLSDLLGEDEWAAFRSLETDSFAESHTECELSAGAEASSTFDSVIIASRLRRLGDQYNEDLEQSAQRIIAEVAKGKVEEFGVMVDSLSKTWSSLNPELGYERAFLAVSVKLLAYLSRKVPAVARRIRLVELINGNREVRGYIETRGGWVSAQGSLKFFCWHLWLCSFASLNWLQCDPVF